MHGSSTRWLRQLGWCLLGLVLCLPAGPALAATSTPATDPGATRRLIITTADGTRPHPTDIATHLGVQVTGIRTLGGDSYAVDLAGPVWPSAIARLPQPRSSARAADRPTIVAASPDVSVQPADLESIPVAGDPRAVEQWALWDAEAPTGGQSIRVGPAWRTTTGDPGVVVAVIDTGITSHPDLDSQIVAGRDFISDPFAAGDGDGVDPDPSDEGDFTPFGFPGCPMGSSSWHGTHVAGAVVARMDDTGVVGVAPGVRVSPVRILGRCGGSLADLIAAIRWAAGEAVDGAANLNPAKVISMSLSGEGTCPSVLAQAVQFARSRGAAVIAAAGNSGGSAASEFPANCPGVHAVTATGRAGQRASYANTGPALAIAAPGGSDGQRILSTSNAGDTVPVGPSYRLMQGTSMATPLVSAAVALVLSAEPALTGEQAWLRVAGNAREFPQATGRDCTPQLCGVGMLDLVGLLPEPAGLAVTGQVTRGGRPAAGVSVSLLPASGEPGYYGRTGADGSYRIPGLPAGQYRVRFTHGPAVAEQAAPLDLTADTPGVNQAWPVLGSISGIVLAAGGATPMPGVDVGLAGPNGAQLFRRTTTDAFGRFTFSDLHAARYRIQAGGNLDAAAATWLGGTDYQGATEIPVADGLAVTGIDVAVRPKPVVLSAASSAPAPPPSQPSATQPTAPASVAPAPAATPLPAPTLIATFGKRPLPGKPRVRLTPAKVVTLTAVVPANTPGVVQFADTAGVLGEAPISGTSAVLRTPLHGGRQAVLARVIAAGPGPDSNAISLQVTDRRAPRLKVTWVTRKQGKIAVRATDKGGVQGLSVRWRARSGSWGPWQALTPPAAQWSAPSWGVGSCVQLRAIDWAGNRTQVQRCR